MSVATPLELVLFATREAQVRPALSAGVSSFICDWECRGKYARQSAADTEINAETVDDLRALTQSGAPLRYCRINAHGAWTAEEVEQALSAGATHLLLPMVRGRAEVDAVTTQVHGRSHVGILIETVDALNHLDDLAQCDVECIYIGLNDLALSRGTKSIFDALVDGTVDRVRSKFYGVRFGCAGVTATDAGSPIPCVLLLAELARLRCDFTFARRSFRRDMAARDLGREVALIQETWQRLGARSASEIESDRLALVRAVEAVTQVGMP